MKILNLLLIPLFFSIPIASKSNQLKNYHLPPDQLLVPASNIQYHGDPFLSASQKNEHYLFQSSTDSVEELWVARYNSTSNDVDWSTAMTIDEFGNVYITGGSFNSVSDYDFATIKYNTLGDLLWVATYNGPGNLYDQAYDIVVDNSGNVYVTGRSTGLTTNVDCATIKYNSSGELQWVTRYEGFSFEWPESIAVDDSGNVYVAGSSQNLGTSFDYITIKYNSSGQEQWVANYSRIPGPVSDFAYAMTIDDSGNVYVTGGSDNNNPSTNRDYVTVKYNTYGIEEWVVRYDGPINSFDEAEAIIVDDSGNVYVTGMSTGSGTGLDYTTIKYNSSGTEAWAARYNGSGGIFNNDLVKAITIDDSGYIYITGISNGYTTIKYNSSGTEIWVARSNNTGYNGANAIAADNSGNVYVTGFNSKANLSTCYTTIKYDALGAEVWIASYQSMPDDYAAAIAIAVDDSNNVYVTGNSYDDYVTIKYKQIPNALPLGPTNLFAFADTFFVELGWTDNSDNETGFKIERKDDSLHIYSPWILIDSVTANVSTYKDTGITPGTTYSYRVYAFNEFGNSSYSDSVEIVTFVPVELVSFDAACFANRILLNWVTASETNNLGFEIERRKTSLNLLQEETLGKWEKIGYVAGYGTSTETKAYSFVDDKVITGLYNYRLKQIDLDGSYSYSIIIEIEVDLIPKEFALYQNYPNPFNPSTVIGFQLVVSSYVTLKIYDMLGQEVESLVNKYLDAGYHKFDFDASTLNSGIYFYKIEAKEKNGNKFNSIKKMVLIK